MIPVSERPRNFSRPLFDFNVGVFGNYVNDVISGN